MTMDRDWGSRTGGGGVASAQNEAINRRERMRKLALETIDLAKDPYFFQNHIGKYECRICATQQNNEGNYLAHTQGRRHQSSLARRSALDAKHAPIQPQPFKVKHNKDNPNHKTVKIGRPGYRVTPQLDAETKEKSLLFQIAFPEIAHNVKPRHRFMSSFEQKVQTCDGRYQYLLFSAEPYEVIGFKVPNVAIDASAPNFFSNWNSDTKMFTLQLIFKVKPQATDKGESTMTH